MKAGVSRGSERLAVCGRQWLGSGDHRHWTEAWGLAHPDVMSPSSRPRALERQRHRPRPLRWTHLFARLFTLAERSRQPEIGGRSVTNRRLQQRLALAQRLMEALPTPLTPGAAFSERFWIALRWGGVGLVLARLLA